MTLSLCPQALGLLTEMFYFKWFCICLGYFLGLLRFSSSSQNCFLSLPFLFLCFFSYYLFSFWQFKKEFYAISFEKGRHCQQPFSGSIFSV